MFDELTNIMGLSFMEQLSIIGQLLKERSLLLSVNLTAESTHAYMSSKEYLCDRFFHLIPVHYAQERSVTFYASKLCVTPKYLSTVVKEVSGKTPYAWIKEETIKGIEYRLCHTQSSLKEIANELNFPNCSFFGKFFKSQIGLSPQQYRRMHVCKEAIESGARSGI